MSHTRTSRYVRREQPDINQVSQRNLLAINTMYRNAILIVADPDVSSASRDLVTSFLRQHEILSISGWDMISIDYEAVIRDPLPQINGRAAVVLCFPHTYWNEHVEKMAPGIYGNPVYGLLLNNYLSLVDRHLRRRFGERLSYLNSPASIALTREKRQMKERLMNAGVPTPRWYEGMAPEVLMAMLEQGKRLYAKCPCGSMGKGISVLAKGNSLTNYAVRDGRFDFPLLASGKCDNVDQWGFVSLDERDPQVIESLCSSGFLFEEVVRGTVGDRRIELRITIVGSEVADYEFRSAPIEAPTTRRIDQGDVCFGTSLGSWGITLPPEVVANACTAALDASKALGLSYCIYDVVFSEEDLKPFIIDAQAFAVLGGTEGVSRLIIGNLTKELRAL